MSSPSATAPLVHRPIHPTDVLAEVSGQTDVHSLRIRGGVRKGLRFAHSLFQSSCQQHHERPDMIKNVLGI